jgi:hypothetical protein
MSSDLEGLLCRVAAHTRTKLAEEVSAPLPTVRAVLEDDEASATGCFLAVRKACGSQCRAWEPESLWLHLERRKIDVPPVNRDKILAAHTITMVPAFWWEVNCFQNTVLAFNSVLSDPEVLQETTPGQLCWGIFEAEMIYSYSDMPETPEFDREPILYTAVCLHRAGYVLAPDLLQFAQKELDKLNGGEQVITPAQVRQAMKRKPKTDPDEDDPVDVQVARLRSVNAYVEEKAKRYQTDIGALV